MPFVTVYGPSTAALGEVAYSAGRGRYNQWVSQMREQIAGRQQQARQFDQSQQLRQQMQERGIQAQAEGQQRGFEQQMMLEEQRGERQQSMMEWEYSERQRREMDKVSRDMEWLQQQDDLAPEEKAAFEKALIAKQLGFQRLPRPKAKKPWPEEQDIGKTWIQNGAVMTRDKNGTPKPLVKPPSVKEINDLWKDVTESLMPNPDSPYPSAEKIRETVIERLNLQRALMGLPPFQAYQVQVPYPGDEQGEPSPEQPGQPAMRQPQAQAEPQMNQDVVDRYTNPKEEVASLAGDILAQNNPMPSNKRTLQEEQASPRESLYMAPPTEDELQEARIDGVSPEPTRPQYASVAPGVWAIVGPASKANEKKGVRSEQQFQQDTMAVISDALPKARRIQDEETRRQVLDLIQVVNQELAKYREGDQVTLDKRMEIDRAVRLIANVLQQAVPEG